MLSKDKVYPCGLAVCKFPLLATAGGWESVFSAVSLCHSCDMAYRGQMRT